MDTNTYVTAVPNVPATSLTAGTCPSGQIVSGSNCVTQTVVTPASRTYLCTGSFQGWGAVQPNTGYGNGAGQCGYNYSSSGGWWGTMHYFNSSMTTNQVDNGMEWLIVTTTCNQGSTLMNGDCVTSTTNNPVANVTTYSCPNGYVLSGVNCMSATYATINATPIWDTVRDWFLGSLIPKVVALTFIAIGIFLTINTVRRNGKKLI